jgi:nitrogen regulatory protein PII
MHRKMSLVTATIPALVLNTLHDELVVLGIKGMTVSQVATADEEDIDLSRTAARLGGRFKNPLQIVIETVVSQALAPAVVEAIHSACHGTQAGRVAIHVSDVLFGVRVRNGDVVHEG